MAAPVNYIVLHKYRCQTGTASQLVSWVVCYICLHGRWYFGEGKLQLVLNMLGSVQKKALKYQSLVRSLGRPSMLYCLLSSECCSSTNTAQGCGEATPGLVLSAEHDVHELQALPELFSW